MAKKQTKSTKKPKKSSTPPSTARKQDVRGKAAAAFQRLRRSRLAKFMLLLLAPLTILLSFFATEIDKGANYVEVFPGELAFPVVMHGLTALVIALIVYFSRWPRNFGLKLVAATTLGIFMVNYDDRLIAIEPVFRACMPLLPAPPSDMAAISLMFLITIVVLVLGVITLCEHLLMRRKIVMPTTNMVLGVGIVLGVVAYGQVVRMFEVLPPVFREARVTAPEFTRPKDAATAEKPDIYYIVLDRYANGQVLRDRLQFDNAPFTDALKARGFTVNDTAHANYPYTALSVASTMNGTYLNDVVAPFKQEEIQSRTLFHNTVRQASAVKALTAVGYEYHSLGSNYGLSYAAPLAGQYDHAKENEITLFGVRKRLHGVEATQFLQSPYMRFGYINSGLWPFKAEHKKELGVVQSQFQKLQELADTPSKGGRFIFAHILVPHPGYYFNADGSLSNDYDENDYGKPIKDKYLNAVQYANLQMQQFIESVDKHSGGKAVVLLNADEGPYPDKIVGNEPDAPPFTDYDRWDTDMTTWTDDWLNIKYGILQAVRIPAATEEDMRHLSSVNLFRIVLNRYLGYRLDYLPDCHYALPQGTQYEYRHTDITARLNGAGNAYCQAHQSK